MYDVSLGKQRLALRAGERQQLTLTITNASDEPSTCLLVVNRQDAPPPGPVSSKPKRKRAEIDRPPLDWQLVPQLTLAARETTQTTAEIRCTSQADVGDYRFEIVIADERNPDERFTTRSLPLLVLPAPEKQRSWWPWILAAVALVLIIALLLILTRSNYVAVPRVVGMTQEAAMQSLQAAGLQVAVHSTDFQELDSQVTPALLRERARALAARTDAAVDTVEPTPWAATDPPPLRENLIWRQSLDGAALSGDTVDISVLPTIDPVPPVIGLELPEAMIRLADAGFRFSYEEGFPPDFSYGDQARGVWRVDGSNTRDWSLFWRDVEAVPTEDEDTENDNTDAALSAQAYRGSRLHLHAMPAEINLPDLTTWTIDQALAATYLNVIFIHDRDQLDRDQVRSSRAVYRRNGRDFTIYRQDPGAGSLLPLSNHTVVLHLSLRDS